ncbi:ABC transporter permease [Cohnella sp. JJ-181]|uniref:ABC transporter permease n=1 Tax=Cohnella rhizoplanae TaxID=2974897 RepID=UPI0022FF64E9|nr:ABC transporter permease [Cohnella sp. JJ-181]CAI6065486.1 hypothetical protein COHCIP112018_02063 [Cohnella sp. JJ-181]
MKPASKPAAAPPAAPPAAKPVAGASPPAGSLIARLHGKYSPMRLVLLRCGAFWLKSVRAWRLTLDWTVVLYLVLPALWVIGGMYADLLRHPPAWIDRVPAQTPTAILALLMVRARLRTFAERGDGLFLRSSGRWVRRMTAAGLTYTLAARLAVSFAAAGLLLPLLAHSAGWSLGSGAALALSAGLSGFVWTAIRDAAERRWQGLRRVAALLALRAAFMTAWVSSAAWALSRNDPVVAVVAIATLAAACIGLGWRRLGVSGTFAHELEAEQRAYGENVGWVLIDTEQAKMPPAGRRPWVLRRPKPLLRRRDEPLRIAELWLRSLLREWETARTLLYFAFLGMIALWLSPLWLAAIAWTGMCGLLLLWLNGLWGRWRGERYMALFEWRDDVRDASGAIGRLLLLRAIGLAWCVVIGTHAGWMYGGLWWLAVALLPAAGYLLLGWINGAATSVLALRLAGKSRSDAGDAT